MPPILRRTVVAAVSLFPVLGIAACASGAKTRHVSAGSTFAAGAVQDERAVAHFLNRITFGARPGDIAAVRRVGAAAFLESQLHPEQIDDRAMQVRLSAFETINLTQREIAERYLLPAQEARRRRQLATQTRAESSTTPGPGAGSPAPGTGRPLISPAGTGLQAGDQEIFRRERLVMLELSDQKLLRAVYSERQLQEVLVDFWFNHFNVFAGKGADRGLITAYERDTIRPHVFGSFRELLGATAESPAMLFFLDNWMSVDPNGPHPAGAAARASGRLPRPPDRRSPGVLVPPRADAVPQRPANAARRGLNENYARELMELHTLGAGDAYTQRDVVEVARCFTGWTIAQPRDGGAFRFDARLHDEGQKIVLGHIIKAGGGKEDGDAVLDILARDPRTARFIATKLVQRFVADAAPRSLVERAANKFRQTDGNLRDVYREILLSPEFWSSRVYRVKVKSPLELVASALRVTGAEVSDAASSVQAVRRLGMPLYFCQPPNGYPEQSESWLNAGTLLNRVNFALALAGNRLPGVQVDPLAFAGSSDVAAGRSTLVHVVLNGDASPATSAALQKAATIPQLVALSLSAPEFQKR